MSRAQRRQRYPKIPPKASRRDAWRGEEVRDVRGPGVDYVSSCPITYSCFLFATILPRRSDHHSLLCRRCFSLIWFKLPRRSLSCHSHTVPELAAIVPPASCDTLLHRRLTATILTKILSLLRKTDFRILTLCDTWTTVVGEYSDCCSFDVTPESFCNRTRLNDDKKGLV